MTNRKRPRAVPDAPPYEMLGPATLDAKGFASTPGALDFAVDARYAWDAGVAISRFLEGLKAGAILARECRVCRRLLVPPRMFCEECFRPTDAWRQVRDTGVVNTFSICHVLWNMEPADPPEIPAVIEIDGASAGMGILHKLGDVRPEDVRIGMQVEAVWKPDAEREGSILDIRYFRPAERGLQKSRRTTGRKKTASKKSSARKKSAGRRRKAV